MSNVTQLNTITLSENTVIISLERYNELLEKEERLGKKIVYIPSSTGFGWNTTGSYIKYDDEASKEIAEDLSKSKSKIYDLESKISVLERTIDGLVKTNNKLCQKTLNWFQRIFKTKK